jgi:hypothetical protein
MWYNTLYCFLSPKPPRPAFARSPYCSVAVGPSKTGYENIRYIDKNLVFEDTTCMPWIQTAGFIAAF